MQREILEASPAADLRVFAVWVSFVGGKSDAADVARQVFSDPRVVQFWDGRALTSEWFAKNVERSAAPVWDAYHLYGPEATWTDAPAPSVSSGGTIIGQSSPLKAAVTRLLAGQRAT